MRWPARPKQTHCLRALWAHIPAGRYFSEIGFFRLFDLWHDFGDAALPRREMWGEGLIHRTPLEADYRRIEQRPPPELRPLRGRIAAQAAA